ncbi:MAG: hypothetical protein ABIN10_04705, partial [Specibacter sp.]
MAAARDTLSRPLPRDAGPSAPLRRDPAPATALWRHVRAAPATKLPPISAAAPASHGPSHVMAMTAVNQVADTAGSSLMSARLH